MIVLQARGGRRMLADDPEETRSALDAIERAGEQALAEMRRLLGLLHAADERAALAPQPGLARLPDLAQDSARPACPSTCESRVRRSSCRRASTSPPTGSSRRR